MQLILLEKVVNLGQLGDIVKVKDGYGRNFLLPQGLAVLATPGALRQVESIRAKATARRAPGSPPISLRRTCACTTSSG